MKATSGLLIFVSALCVPQTSLSKTPPGPPTYLPFSQLEVGLDSPVKKSGVVVITNQDQWDGFLKKMNESTQKRSKIDWSKFEIVVATLEGSTNSGISIKVDRLQTTKAGKTDIEIGLDPQIGNSRLINTTNSENYLGRTQYPYVIFQTPITSTKWNIKVAE
jgi:hypothetical protein